MSTYIYTKFDPETAQISLDNLLGNPAEENELGILTDIESTFETYNAKYDDFLSSCMGELSSGGELYDYYSSANEKYNGLIETLSTAITEYNGANQNGYVTDTSYSPASGSTTTTEDTSTTDTTETTDEDSYVGETIAETTAIGAVGTITDTLTDGADELVENKVDEVQQLEGSVDELKDSLSDGEIVEERLDELNDTLSENGSIQQLEGSVDEIKDRLSEGEIIEERLDEVGSIPKIEGSINSLNEGKSLEGSLESINDSVQNLEQSTDSISQSSAINQQSVETINNSINDSMQSIEQSVDSLSEGTVLEGSVDSINNSVQNIEQGTNSINESGPTEQPRVYSVKESTSTTNQSTEQKNDIPIAPAASGVGLAGVVGAATLMKNKKNKKDKKENKYIAQEETKKEIKTNSKEKKNSFVEEYLDSNY